VSIRNPFSGYGFRVDPDNLQDRKNSEPVTRKMTPEEIEEYGCVVKRENKQSDIGAVQGMVRKEIIMTKINKERLIDICTEHGFTAQAYRIAAKEFDVPPNSVANYVSNNKLKKILASQNKQKVPNTNEDSLHQENLKDDLSSSNDINDEMEIIIQIKSILQKNKSLSRENITLKENMLKVKAALEDILKSIA
jgi:L-cysteine desulfidase